MAKHVSCDVCGSSDGKVEYGPDDWWCFVCNKGKRPGGKNRDSFEVEEELYVSGHEKIADIQGLPIRGFKEREITKSVTEFFGVRAEVAADGTVAKHFYPYGDKAFKCRVVEDKEFYWVGKSDELFGRDKFSSDGKRLIITEGELDAMSIAQAAHSKYNKIYPVVSLPSASGTKALLKHRDWVRSFAEVVLCLDNDEAGQKCLAECIKIIGAEKIKIAKLPVKDASEMLTTKGSPALMTAIFEAGRYTPAGIVSKEEIWKALVEYNEAESLPYPPCLGGLNSKLKGMRMGEIALFISGTGCFAPGTMIRMLDGGVSCVEDIEVGDYVMGPCNMPREVLTLFTGEELMHRITLEDGTSFVCNDSHRLAIRTNGEMFPVLVSEYLTWPEKKRRQARQYKAGNMIGFSFVVEPIGIGEFYGFEVNADNRFVLGNGVITYNSGKSTMLRETMLHIIQTTQDAIGIIALEESPAETARKLAGMQLMRNPAAEEISIEDLQPAFEDVFGNDRVFCLDHQGSMADVSIVNQLEYMALMGCKYLFIDHITILVSEGAEDLTGNEAVDKIMNHLLRIVKKHNVWIGLVSHLRKAQSGQKSFEEGRLPSIDDIRGCLAYDTGILLSNGRARAVQDIKVGDLLMGDDGLPREVLRLFDGEQQMYRITTKTSNDSFICNEDHILTLSHNDRMRDVRLGDFLKESENWQFRCKQHYSTGYELPEIPVLIPAYSFGAWLGDGSKSAFRIMDASDLGISNRVAGEIGAELLAPSDPNREYFNFNTGLKGEMLDKLRQLGVWENKHVPDVYVFNSKAVRYNLLAGLIDTDGCYNVKDNAYYFYQKCEDTARKVVRIARSLGLYSTVHPRIISGSYTGSNGSTIFEVAISGDIKKIPAQKSTRIVAKVRRTDPLKRGILIEKLDVQPYFGFQLSGNGRFLLENHTVTHNSGSIKQISFDIISFARNLIAEDPKERNTILMRVLKSRYTGLTGNVRGAQYHYDTGRLELADFDPDGDMVEF
jgi:hypothetical protein